MAGHLATLWARIKVDQTNCFGMVGWTTVGNSASGLPEHDGAAQSLLEQERVEQGDVEWPGEAWPCLWWMRKHG